jgi:hypothetical protein
MRFDGRWGNDGGQPPQPPEASPLPIIDEAGVLIDYGPTYTPTKYDTRMSLTQPHQVQYAVLQWEQIEYLVAEAQPRDVSAWIYWVACLCSGTPSAGYKFKSLGDGWFVTYFFTFIYNIFFGWPQYPAVYLSGLSNNPAGVLDNEFVDIELVRKSCWVPRGLHLDICSYWTGRAKDVEGKNHSAALVYAQSLLNMLDLPASTKLIVKEAITAYALNHCNRYNARFMGEALGYLEGVETRKHSLFIKLLWVMLIIWLVLLYAPSD